jgi:hypothetical protein
MPIVKKKPESFAARRYARVDGKAPYGGETAPNFSRLPQEDRTALGNDGTAGFDANYATRGVFDVGR